MVPANADKGNRMLATRKLVTVFSILAAGMIVAPVFALKVTEPAAASHGYPGLCANPAPAGFLRWEGPIVLPTDPIVRVDLLSGEKSGPAEAAGS